MHKKNKCKKMLLEKEHFRKKNVKKVRNVVKNDDIRGI